MKFHPNYLHPQTKAIMFTGILAVAGIVGAQHADGVARDMSAIYPLIIFYITLLINSYPSIKLFSSITPMEDPFQQGVDILLFVTYLFLAYAFYNPLWFIIGVIFLFAFASLKYILLMGTIPHPKLLKKKIILDILGTLFGTVTLTLYLIGFTTFSLWSLAILFVLANTLFLVIKPMYRLID